MHSNYTIDLSFQQFHDYKEALRAAQNFWSAQIEQMQSELQDLEGEEREELVSDIADNQAMIERFKELYNQFRQLKGRCAECGQPAEGLYWKDDRSFPDYVFCEACSEKPGPEKA